VFSFRGLKLQLIASLLLCPFQKGSQRPTTCFYYPGNNRKARAACSSYVTWAVVHDEGSFPTSQVRICFVVDSVVGLLFELKQW